MLAKLRFEPQAKAKAKAPSRLKAWRRTVQDPGLSVEAPQVLNRDSDVFVIGSCFANEIRAVLETKDVSVHPRLDPRIAELLPDELKVDPMWGKWDERVHYQCYTPFSILQEMRVALGLWEPPAEAVFSSKKGGKTRYWDPYRRAIFTHSRPDTLAVREIMNRHLREGVETADVLVFTLGLIESFTPKGYDGVAAEFNMEFRSKLQFVDNGYAQAHQALAQACDLVLERYPDKRILLTVSPIPLNRTFTDDDVITASTRGKSILRAAAASVVRDRPQVSYWPSYEFVMWRGDAFREDKRHVRPEVVAEITSAFCESWFQPGALEPGAAHYPQKAATAASTPSASPKRPSPVGGLMRNVLELGARLNMPGLQLAAMGDLPPKTAAYFTKQLLHQARQLFRQLADEGTVLRKHGDQSKEDYEVYGDREMRAYETDSALALREGELVELPYRTIRAAYIAPVAAAIRELISQQQGPVRVLEVGCGNGTNLMLLGEQLDAAVELTGIDIAEGRLREGRKYWGERLANIEMTQASATDLSCFDDNAFDLVYSICALEQITYRLHEVVAEMVRLAHKRIVCVEPVYHFGNPAQRLYNIVSDQCRTLLPELQQQCSSVNPRGLMSTLHYPMNPVGLIIATP